MDWQELKREFKTLKVFYGLYFIVGLASILEPFWVIYFLQINLTFWQIGALLSIGSIMAILFEVPTGAIADIYGRKFSVGLAWLFAGILLTLIYFITDFWVLFLVFIVFGITNTLGSGADHAWLVDFLKWKKKSKYSHSAFSRIESIMSLGTVFSAIAGFFVVALMGLKFIWLFAGALSFFGSAYIFIFGKEKFEREHVNLKGAVIKTWNNAKQSFKFSRRHPVIFWLMAYFLLVGLTNFNELMFQPIFVELGLSVEMLGLVFASAYVVGVIVPNFSRKFLAKFKTEKYVLILTEFLYFIAWLIIYYFYTLWVAILFWLFVSIIYFLQNPVLNHYFQRHVPSKQRATTSSIKNWVIGVGTFISMTVGGYLIDMYGIRPMMLVLALSSIPTILVLNKLKNN